MNVQDFRGQDSGVGEFGQTEYNRKKDKLKQTTQDFEAIFLGMMLKQMRKSVAGQDALFGKSHEVQNVSGHDGRHNRQKSQQSRLLRPGETAVQNDGTHFAAEAGQSREWGVESREWEKFSCHSFYLLARAV